VFSLQGGETSANFQSCNFRNNGYSVTTFKTGGVMRLAQSTVSFIECAFHGNQASQGGVIQALRGSAVTVIDSEFEKNVGILGGVITISPGVLANFIRSNIENNMARFGAVVAYLGGGKVQFVDSNIRHNRATALGGTAFLSMGFGPTIHFSGSSIANNTADSKGGALYASAGTRCTFTDCVVAMNTAGDEGGAVYSEQESNIFLEGSQFVANKALMRPRLMDISPESSNAAHGDHIFLDDPDSNLVSCSTGGNTFADPSEDEGVKFMDGKSACI
jgi:Chlamydia polymorphic membrane protein (Chlamydia_PMP) repeat